MTKIQTTTRILVRNRILYVSSWVATQLKHLLYRLPRNRMAPLRDKSDELVDELIRLYEEDPRQFSNSAITILHDRYISW